MPLNRKLLIITYYWPPAAGPGVQRWLKLTKFLNQLGWDPLILTVKDGSYPATDASLSAEVLGSMQVYRSASLEPHRLYNLLRGKKGKAVEVGMGNVKDAQSPLQKLAKYIRSNYFIPDARVGWNRYAYRMGLQIMQAHKIDAIITTGPPHSTHLIGLQLKKKTGTPWLADLRDPWTTIVANKYLNRSARTERIDQQLEDKVIQSADLVSVVGKGMQKEFHDRNPKTFVLYNGYDPEDLPKLSPQAPEKFKMAYVGNFKAGQNHDPLWEAIGELLQENLDFQKYFQLRLTGNVENNIRASIQNYGVQANVLFNGYVSHTEAVNEMLNADILLFVIFQIEGNKKIITGKLFEYLASRRPIFAIGPPEGNADEILRKCKRSPILDFDQKEPYKEDLLAYFNEWKNNDKHLKKVENNIHELFTRENQAKILSEQLEKMITNQ